MVPALGGAASASSPAGSPVSAYATGPQGGVGDIPVGAGQAQAQAARYAPYGSSVMPPQQQQLHHQPHPSHQLHHHQQQQQQHQLQQHQQQQQSAYGSHPSQQMGQQQQQHPSQMQQAYGAYAAAAAAPGQYANAYALPGYDGMSMSRGMSGNGAPDQQQQ
jgi:membrane protein involved in colicin uptake